MECPRCFFAAKNAPGDESWCGTCGRSYRPGVNVYLGLLALVYLAFVMFVKNMLTPTWLSFNLSLRPKPSVWIFGWERFPVDILSRPEMILILGGALALVILVPLVVAILYGKRGGVLLALVALIAGPSWPLGLLLILGSWLAGGWTVRLSSKVASCLLACVPAWIFCLAASQPRADVPLVGAYYLPALVAIVFDVALVLAILIPLRLAKWRARVAGIALAALCLVPAAAFQIWVGPAEVQYALFNRDCGLDSSLFVDESGTKVAEELKEIVDKRLEVERKKVEFEKKREARGQSTGGLHVLGLPDEPPDPLREAAELQRTRIDFEFKVRESLRQQKTTIARRSLQFLRQWPTSPRAADVLFTMARALDMDVDTTAFRSATATNTPIRYNWTRMQLEDSKKILDGLAVDFPGSAYHTSADVWQALLTRFPTSPYSAAAEAKQADFAARQGQFEQAIAAYGRILRAYKPEVDKPLPDLSGLSLFTNLFDVGDRLRARQRAERIDEQYRIAQHEYEFLTTNLDCPNCHNLVLRELLKIPLFEPADERRAKLVELQKLCPKCKLSGNLAFELAMTEPRLTAEETVGGKGGPGRLELLEKVVKNYPGSNGAAEALLALADLETHLAGNRAAHLAQAIEYYKQLLEDYPKSYLAREAGEQRLMLQSQLAAGRGGKQ